jgi:hypothetical protein
MYNTVVLYTDNLLVIISLLARLPGSEEGLKEMMYCTVQYSTVQYVGYDVCTVLYSMYSTVLYSTS